MPSHKNTALRAVLLLSFAVSAGFGQGGATVSGLVQDGQGAAIAGASVTLVARDNTASAAVTTDPSGRYRFERVPPGAYLVEASAAGFERSGVRPVTVEKSDQADINFELRIAAVETSVVVTASSTAQTTDELSKAVSVVDASTLDLSDEASVADALRYVPGLRVEEQGGPGGLVSLKTRGLPDQDTAVLIDGFRMRDASAPQGDATGLLQDLIVTDVDRIEVVGGAGSSLYGTDALGGVVNILTASGGGRTRGSLLAEGGSLDMFRGRAELAGGIGGDRLQYTVGLGEFDVLSGVTGDAPARTASGQSRLDYSLTPTIRIFGRIFAADSFSKVDSSPEAAGNLPASGIINAVPLSASQLRLYEAGAPLSALNYGNATYIPDFDNPDSTRAARIFSGAVRLSAHPNDTLGFSVSYQGLVTRRRFADGPAGAGYQPDGNETAFYDGDIHTVDARADWRLGKHQLIDAGYEFEDEKYGNRSLMPDPADNSTVDVSQQSHAVFGQDQISLLGDRLQVAGSYRAQFFFLRQPFLSPASGAPYSGMQFPAPPTAQTGDGSAAYFLRRTGTKIRAHAGRGYRAPSLYERFGTDYSSIFGYSVYGDPRLRPERSISVDGGIDQSLWNGRARLSATYFYTRLQETIAFGTVTNDPFGRFEGYLNSNGGLARGAEVSASWAPARSTTLLATYTYTNARERTPIVENVLQTFIIPSHQASLSATQRMGARFTAVFNLAATGDYLAPLFNAVTFAELPFRFPGKRLAELGGSYRIPLGESQSVRFFAKASNIFNQSYFESGYQTPGATAQGGLQFFF